MSHGANGEMWVTRFMRRFQKATIKDVARHAGVSTTTVSVFVSGRENVCSPETAARIRAAVSALNYTPSSLINGAQKKVMRTFGVCMPNPLTSNLHFGNRFFERLWQGITVVADAENYSLLLYPSGVRNATTGVDAFLDGRVDGVLFHKHDNIQPAKVAAAGMPTVLLTRSLNLPEEAGAVWADEMGTMSVALTHLWELGHRRIAHIAGPIGGALREFYRPGAISSDDVAIQRLHAYETWMHEHGEDTDSLVAHADSWQGEAIPEIVASWQNVPERPTAVVCANDILALRLMNEVQQLGWRVPEDLSIIGVDNSSGSIESNPRLTSVEVAIEEVGREAVHCLLRLMAGAPLAECRVALPISTLVMRDSTAPPLR